MEILVFKTNIHKKKDVRRVSGIFKKEKDILTWNVDLQDDDKVLRVEALCNITTHIEATVSKAGYYCRELQD